MSARETGWRLEQCRFLYSGMPGAIAVSGVIALILAMAQSSVVAPGRVIAWLAMLGAVSLGRMALWRMNRKAAALEEQSALWLRRYRIGVFAAGLAWALGGYLLFTPGNLPHQAFLAFAIAGVSAGAAIAQAADRFSPMLFASPPLATLVALQMMEGEALALSMGVMVLLFFAFILFNAVRSHGRLHDLWRYRSTAIRRDAQLASSEARLDHLLSSGPAVIYSCDIAADFPVSYISPNVAGMMGYTAEEFLAAPGFWAAHVHPDDLAHIRALQRDLLARGRANLEYRFHHKSGAWRWTRDDQIVIRDPGGAAREIVGAWTDITARKAAEQAAAQQSEFQRLVAVISAAFINVDRSDLDRTIDEALRTVGSFFGVDRSYVFRFAPERAAVDNTHEWCAAGIEPQRARLQNVPVSRFRWHLERLVAGNVLQIADVDDLPAEAAADRQEFKRQGTRSLLALPMMRQGECIGFFGFDSVTHARRWSEDEAALLKVMADVIAGALIREQAATALAESNTSLERRVAERTAALSESEQRLARAQRTARLGSWEYDPRSGAWHWSDEFYRIFGLDASMPAAADAWTALIHPEDRAEVLEVVQRSRESGRSYEIQYRIIRPDGQLRVLRARGEGEQDGRRVGSVMDVTEQAQAERALAEAQRIAHLGNWEFDEEAGTLRWSDEVYRIFGVEPGSIAPTIAWVEAHIHPEDLERVRRTWQSPDDRPRRYEHEYRIVRPSGEVRRVAEIGEPAQWAEAGGVSYVGTVLDITERTRAERNLAEAQRIAKTGSWEMLPDREENRWSEELYRLLGLSAERDAATDANWNRLIHPDDRDAVVAAYLAANQQQKSYAVRYRLIRPDGELRYMAERGEWIDGRFVGTLSDITEQERVQRSFAVAQHIASTGSWEYQAESDDHWWSDEMYHLLGLARGAATSNDGTWDALIHADEREAVRAAYVSAYDDRTGYEIRYRVVRPDGETRFMVERGAWIDGRFSGTLSDITEQERVWRALAEAQRIAATGSWEARPGSELQWWSDEMYRLFGLRRGAHESTEAAWHARIHPADRAAATTAARTAHAVRQPYEIRYRLIRPNGETRFAVERGEWIDDRFTGTLSDITEQERAQRSLAEAHRIAKVGSWEWIPGTKKLRWSDEARRIFGYGDGLAERDNRDWQKRVHPDDQAAVEAILDANRERGIPFELAYRIVLPDGAIRMIHEWIESELDDQGELIREVGIFQDVTESKQLELAMQALSRELIALEGAAYFTAAVERLSKLLNVEHVYIARMAPAGAGALRIVAAIHDGQPAAGNPAWTEEAPGTELAAGQSILIDRGAWSHYPGGAIAVDAIEGYAGEPIGDHDGRIIGQIAVMSRRPLADPTTARTILRMFRVAAAAAIGRERVHQRDAWLRAILDNTPSAVVLKDLDLRVMAVSRKDAAEHGMTPDEAVGKRTRDMFPPELAAIYESADRKVIETGQPIRQDVVEKEDGKIRHIQNVKFPMRDENGRIIGVCSISDDLTAVKHVEAQLAHAQKMEALGALTGGMAHDFNNYLAVIIGNLDMLREDMAGNPDAVALVDAALRGAMRSEELTRSLLAFARRQPLAPTIVHVGERIEETARLLGRTLGEDIAIAVSVAPGLWPALVDGARLASCLVNLANNARDAMPSGGTIGISARNEHVDALYEALGPDIASGDYVLIEVTDDGVGMKPEVLANALEPFFTTKGPGHGTGLGLSMVYGFVKQSGGALRIYSEAGQGTTVRLYLPRGAAPAAKARRGADDGLEMGGGETILVVEDNKMVRNTVARQLVMFGYQVIEAASGDAAVPILQQADRRIDLMLSDVVMPGKLNGYALARLAHELRPAMKVVLTSGFVTGQAGKPDDGFPAPMLLSKPYRGDQLARALREALGSKPQ